MNDANFIGFLKVTRRALLMIVRWIDEVLAEGQRGRT